MALREGSPRRVVVVDGCGTPFCPSSMAFADVSTFELVTVEA